MASYLTALVEPIAKALLAKNLRLTTAESCTGGGVAYALTTLAGSSTWFERGFVTYSNEAKQEMLDVPITIIQQHGAVSQETAEAMAYGALQNSHADISLAVTGIAGPAGGSPEKPVGTVWFAWASNHFSTISEVHLYQGDRMTIREQAIVTSLKKLLALI